MNTDTEKNIHLAAERPETKGGHFREWEDGQNVIFVEEVTLHPDPPLPPVLDEDELDVFSDGDHQGFSVYAGVIVLWARDYDTRVLTVVDQMPSKPLVVFERKGQILILWENKETMLQHGKHDYPPKDGDSFSAFHWYKDKFCLVEFEGLLPNYVLDEYGMPRLNK